MFIFIKYPGTQSYPNYDEVIILFEEKLKKLGIENKKEITNIQKPLNNNSFTLFFKNYMHSLKERNQFGLLQKTGSVDYLLDLFCFSKSRDTIMYCPSGTKLNKICCLKELKDI